MNTRTLATVSLALALLAVPLAAITINFSSYTDTNYFRVIRDDGTPIKNITWSSGAGSDGNAGRLDSCQYADTGYANWLYDVNGYGAGSNVFEEGYCEFDFNQQTNRIMQALMFAISPKNAIKIKYRKREGTESHLQIATNANITTDYDAGSVNVVDLYTYPAQLVTGTWMKMRLTFGNNVVGSDKYRWVRATVYDAAVGGTMRIDRAWTNTIANEYTQPGEVGLGRVTSSAPTPEFVATMFDNFGVIPEPAAGLALLLGVFWLRRTR